MDGTEEVRLRLQRRGSAIDRGSILAFLKAYCPECGGLTRRQQASDRGCSVEELPEPCENGDPERCATRQIQTLDTLWKGELLPSLPRASLGYALFAFTESGALRFVIQTPHMPNPGGDGVQHPFCKYVALELIDLA